MFCLTGWAGDTGDGAAAGEHAEDGWVFVVDPGTLERVEFPLGELAESQRSGLRYLITSEDDLSDDSTDLDDVM